MSIVKNIRYYFLQEKLRDKFSRENKLDELNKTYYHGSLPINNINSGVYWDTMLADYSIEQRGSEKDKIRTVLKCLKKVKGNYLGIGFGNAFLEKKVIKINKHLKIFGIDISRKSVIKANKIQDFNMCKASIYNIPFKSNYFSVVVAMEVFEHLSPFKVIKAYKEVYRVLKNDGVFIISVPLNEDLENMIIEDKNPNCHLRRYTPELLKSELLINGFNCCRDNYFYAFKNLYLFKKIISKYYKKRGWKYNSIIIFANKI